MNLRLHYLFVVCAFLFVSCHKKDDEPGIHIPEDFPESYSFYEGKCDDYSLFSKSTKTISVYNTFDCLMANHLEYISKHYLGKASDGQDLYYYEFSCDNAKDRTKVIIICSQHGFEKNSTFGTYYFLTDVADNNGADPFLQYVHDHLHLIVVPVTNPSGFDDFIYKNANGVNLNRNWPVDGWQYIPDRSSSDYSGVAPLDQPETSLVNGLVERNLDARLFIDFHTYGKGVLESAEQINWISLPYFDNKTARKRLQSLSKEHLENISAYFKSIYGRKRPVLNDTPQLGYISKASEYGQTGFCGTSMSQRGILALTFEGFNGFPGDSKPFLPDVAKANSELLGNFLYKSCYLFFQ